MTIGLLTCCLLPDVFQDTSFENCIERCDTQGDSCGGVSYNTAGFCYVKNCCSTVGAAQGVNAAVKITNPPAPVCITCTTQDEAQTYLIIACSSPSDQHRSCCSHVSLPVEGRKFPANGLTRYTTVSTQLVT